MYSDTLAIPQPLRSREHLHYLEGQFLAPRRTLGFNRVSIDADPRFVSGQTPTRSIASVVPYVLGVTKIEEFWRARAKRLYRGFERLRK